MVKLVGLFSLQHNHTFVRELFPESLGGLVGVDDIRQIDIRIRFVDEVIELLQHLHHRHLRVVEITVLLNLRTESGQRRVERKVGAWKVMKEFFLSGKATGGAARLVRKKTLFTPVIYIRKGSRTKKLLPYTSLVVFASNVTLGF